MTSSGKFPLLSLPAELRIAVYEHLIPKFQDAVAVATSHNIRLSCRQVKQEFDNEILTYIGEAIDNVNRLAPRAMQPLWIDKPTSYMQIATSETHLPVTQLDHLRNSFWSELLCPATTLTRAVRFILHDPRDEKPAHDSLQRADESTEDKILCSITDVIDNIEGSTFDLRRSFLWRVARREVLVVELELGKYFDIITNSLYISVWLSEKDGVSYTKKRMGSRLIWAFRKRQ